MMQTSSSTVPTGNHLKPVIAAVVPSSGTPWVCWKDAVCLCVLCSGRDPRPVFPEQNLGL